MKLSSNASFRNSEAVFLVEGFRECRMAMESSYVLEKFLICPDRVPRQSVSDLYAQIEPSKVIEISKKVYSVIAYRESSEGVVSIFRKIRLSLGSIELKSSLKLLILDGLEKPGNVGAILRTSDAVALDAVIIVNSKVDLYNPNLIRSSLGALFTNKVILSNIEDIVAFCTRNGIKIFSADLNAQESCYEQNFNQSLAFVVGSESSGVDKKWSNHAHVKKIYIPMKGKVDSMNVSVSAAILLYEVFRRELGK